MIDEAAITDLGESLKAALGDRYSGIERIGEGGMAVVFRATDTHLDRTVAIKVMSPALRSDQEARARFQREARAAASLAHTNVVPIFTVDTIADDLPYLSMQFVDGGTLEDVISEGGALDPDRAERYVRQIASALEAAHRHGIVHRDIKPQNVLVDQENDRLLLTDFGIAKGADEGSTHLTSVGSLVGSPRYMSPEQAAGDPLDQRSDIYSMGVVAYELLAGHPPFESETIQKMVISHLTEPPPPLHDLRGDCPPALLDAVHRCLAKEAGHRYQSAHDLIDDLDEARRASGADDFEVGSGWARLHPLRRAQIVLAATIVTTAGGVALDVLLFGGVTLSVGVVAVAALVLIETVSRMWVEGFDLRNLLSLRARGPEHPSRDRREFVATGPRADVVRSSRAERALLLRAFQGLARSEQVEFPRLRSTADRLLREVSKTARELDVLDTRIQPDGGGGSPGPGIRAHAPEKFEEARGRLELELQESMDALQAIREAISEYASLGAKIGLEPIHASLRKAREGLNELT